MLKRMIVLSLITISIGCNPIQALDIDIPGAIPDVPEDEYQNYRVDNIVTQELEKTIERGVADIRRKKTTDNGDSIDLESEKYIIRELNHALSYSSSVFILKNNGADLKFTSHYVSEAAIAGKSKTDGVIGGAFIPSHVASISYEFRKQPKGYNWENTNIPYAQLNKDILEKELKENEAGAQLVDGGVFTYKGLEKASWDVVRYSPYDTVGSINFTLPNTPTVSYHIGHSLKPTVIDHIEQGNDKALVTNSMSPLVNFVLPSIKPASEILTETKPVTVGSYTFRLMKDSEHISTKTLSNGGTQDTYIANGIIAAIFKMPLTDNDNIKTQNVLFNIVNDIIPLVNSSGALHYAPIQFATVWNDATPGLYMEIERPLSTLFIMSVYDDSYRYMYFINKPNNFDTSNYILRDVIQYVDYKYNDSNYERVKFGLGNTRIESIKSF